MNPGGGALTYLGNAGTCAALTTLDDPFFRADFQLPRYKFS